MDHAVRSQARSQQTCLQEAEDLGVIDKQEGKVEHALAGRFLSSANAPLWRQLQVFEKGAREASIFQKPAPPARAAVVLACYRTSGQALLQPWRDRLVKALRGSSSAVDLVELNLIDISVLASQGSSCAVCFLPHTPLHLRHLSTVATTCPHQLGLCGRLCCAIVACWGRVQAERRG